MAVIACLAETREGSRVGPAGGWAAEIRDRVSRGGRAGVGEPKVLSAEAQHHEFPRAQPRLDQLEIRLRLVGVEEALAANRPGTDFVGSCAVLADMALQMDGRRSGGVAGTVEDLRDDASGLLDGGVVARRGRHGPAGKPTGAEQSARRFRRYRALRFVG